MSTQPELELVLNPLGLIISKKNQQFAKHLLSNGMETKKISNILMDFFSFKVVLRDILAHANNPEWVEYVAYFTTINKQYKAAIKSLEKILNIQKPFSNSDIVPGIIKTPDRVNNIVSEDIEYLKIQQARFVLPRDDNKLKPSIKPTPLSVQQMLNFQSYALYQYLKQFKGQETDLKIYNFIAELFRNLYKDTDVKERIKGLNGDRLKKNFIDNAEKLREKYDELEKSIKPFLSS